MAVSGRRQFLRTCAAATAGAAINDVTQASSGQQEPLRINHDLHTHTVYSDGASTIALHVLEARAFELDAIAITDHYTPGSKIFESDADFDRYLAEIEKERSAQQDVIVLKGAEATALDATGRISIGERHAAKLQWLLCDLGGQSEGTLRNPPADKQQYVENVIRTYLGLCDVPYLDAIAHPFNTGNTRPSALPADYPQNLLRELAAKMADKGKAFDVMNDTIYWFHQTSIAPRELTAQYVELVRLFAAAGVKFQVSSDDHRTGLGNTRWAQLVVNRAQVQPSQIVDPREIARRKS
ncbi:MAG: PHP domain-containing protein [Phycisphaerales bacterium]|jgi:histidinol phosphatase-like PHP family hydrolase